MPPRFSCLLYHVYAPQHKKNPPKLDDVIIFAITYIVIGSITTFIDGASTTNSSETKEINTPICSIAVCTNQGKAIIQVSEPKLGGFDIDLENLWNDLFEKKLPKNNDKLHAKHLVFHLRLSVSTKQLATSPTIFQIFLFLLIVL